ncbi:MAG: hypothetical protein K2G85_07400 [Muribaculaceae bacterium]|nr:hypothetical protein [Muribaculaceae bacterium]
METANKYSDKSFSMERLAILAKSDFIVNKGNYLKLVLSALGVFVAIAVLISINAISEINEIKKTYLLVTGGMIKARQISYSSMFLAFELWVFFIGLTVFGSLTFSSLSSKKQRIVTLMQPASLTEKFLLRMFVYLICGFIALAIGFFIGCAIIQLSFGGCGVMMEGIRDFFSSVKESGYIVAIFILLALAGNSIYTLGSSLWPKLSWLKTWIVLMAVQWIGAIFLITGVFSNFNFEEFFKFFENPDIFLWCVIIVLSALNIGCWFITWLQFKNTQIIQRFMKK